MFVVDAGSEWEQVGTVDLAMVHPVSVIGNYNTDTSYVRAPGTLARLRFMAGALTLEQVRAMHQAEAATVATSIAANSVGACWCAPLSPSGGCVSQRLLVAVQAPTGASCCSSSW